MTAIFRINQPGITGGKPPVGDWDKARGDLDLFGVGGSVGLEAQDTMVNYFWEVVSEVEGSSITLGTPTTQTATMDITVTGGYLVRLTVDEGLPTKDISERYVGVPLPGSTLPIPALSETVQDNSVAELGSERKMTAWMKWVDALVGSGGGIFEAPSGPTLSTLRTGSGATVLGDYCFSAGALNTIDVDSSFCFVYGGHTSAGSQNEVVDSDYLTIFGYDNVVENASYSSIHGRQNELWGMGNHIFGQDNILGSAILDVDSCFVAGEANNIQGHEIVALGIEHWSEVNGSRSTLLGNYALARWPGSLHHAMNPFLAYGAGQHIVSTHMSKETADDSWADLQVTAGGPIFDLEMQNQTIYSCELRLIARTVDGHLNPSELKTWLVQFTAHNDYNNNAVLFPITKTVLAATSVIDEASWDVDVVVTMATSPPQIVISVKGAAFYLVRWYGVLSTVYYEDIDLGPPEE